MSIRHSIRTYHELISLPTFKERFEYLKLSGSVGKQTFGFERYLNQKFYQSVEWRQLRDKIITRDRGCDLAMDGYDIVGRIYIHHMNPIEVDDIREASEYLLNPDYLITTTHDTHNAIHYGDGSLLVTEPIERKPNDTCPWKQV